MEKEIQADMGGIRTKILGKVRVWYIFCGLYVKGYPLLWGSIILEVLQEGKLEISSMKPPPCQQPVSADEALLLLYGYNTIMRLQ